MLGNSYEASFEIDIERWAPQQLQPKEEGHWRLGEDVVIEFPYEHRKEVDTVLAIYGLDEVPKDLHLWGSVSPEAEHRGFTLSTLSWVTLLGRVEAGHTPATLYDTTRYRDVSWPAGAPRGEKPSWSWMLCRTVGTSFREGHLPKGG